MLINRIWRLRRNEIDRERETERWMVMTNEERNMTNCSAKLPLTLSSLIFQRGKKWARMHACTSYVHICIEIVVADDDDDRAVRQWKIMIQSEIAFNKTKCSHAAAASMSPAGTEKESKETERGKAVCHAERVKSCVRGVASLGRSDDDDG